MKYTKGDTVVYGGSGVCKVDDIKDISFYHERPQKYYILKPLFTKQQELVVYVPYDNEKLVSRMQPVISKEEAIKLIDDISDVKLEWIEDRNQRKDTYGSIVTSGSRREIVDVISLIRNRRATLEAEGKRLNMQDEKLLLEAERRMNAEFAVALDIDFDKVEAYISDKAAAAI